MLDDLGRERERAVVVVVEIEDPGLLGPSVCADVTISQKPPPPARAGVIRLRWLWPAMRPITER